MRHVATDVLDGLRVDGARLAEICERYGIAELSIFGSVAQGRATVASDVDLLYVMQPGRSLGFAINRLEDELEDLFDRGVDLVAKQAVHRLMRDTVLSDARIIYAA